MGAQNAQRIWEPEQDKQLPPRNSIPIQRPEVRMPSGPPVTLTWPVTFRFLPSKLTTASALSTMLCASNVLPSWLHATPCGHCPILTSATFVSVVPLTLKTTSRGIAGLNPEHPNGNDRSRARLGRKSSSSSQKPRHPMES